MPKLPFISYYILPAQGIVRNNIHIGHVSIDIRTIPMLLFGIFQVKEDIEALMIALSPILYIFHRDIPKPHALHASIIQNLAVKVNC